MQFDILIEGILDSVSAKVDQDINKDMRPDSTVYPADPQLDKFIQELDWRHDPSPSPYQQRALGKVLDIAVQSPEKMKMVYGKLKQYNETIQKKDPTFTPCPYHLNLQSFLIKRLQRETNPAKKEQLKSMINYYNSELQ